MNNYKIILCSNYRRNVHIFETTWKKKTGSGWIRHFLLKEVPDYKEGKVVYETNTQMSFFFF